MCCITGLYFTISLGTKTFQLKFVHVLVMHIMYAILLSVNLFPFIPQIALVPSVNSIPIFQGVGAPLEMRLEFERFNCREQQLAARHPDDISDTCKQYIFSISSIVQKGALGESVHSARY